MLFHRKLFKNLFQRHPAPQQKTMQQWSIGIYTGNSISELEDPGNNLNPVLSPSNITGQEALIVADPFMIEADQHRHMFFEVEVRTQDGSIGKIGHAISIDGFKWEYTGIVLEEPFHLSYPYVFRNDGQIYMVPETRTARSIRLYKAIDFPAKWVHEKDLLKGKRYADNSLFHFNNTWWMFTDSGNHTLRLYYSKQLLGKWKEHPKSPLLKKQPRTARPGGRVIISDGFPIRFAQDAYPVYGSRVHAFKITDLSPTTYAETQLPDPIIQESGNGWNSDGMHTVDAHQLPDGKLLACVDGLELIHLENPA